MDGAIVDLSEGRLRCVLKGFEPAKVGEVVSIVTVLPEVTVTCLGEVIRHHPRDDDLNEWSVRFIGLSEHEEDLVRRRVFARLRAMRQRGRL